MIMLIRTAALACLLALLAACATPIAHGPMSAGSAVTASADPYRGMKALKYPNTNRGDQVDVYHGVTVADPYRWLEDESSAETKAWVEAQNAVTRAYLDGIPYRDALLQRIRRVSDYARYRSPRKAGDFYFVRRNSGLQNQSVIYRQKGLDGELEVFIDPNALSADGTTRVSLGGLSKDKSLVSVVTQPLGADWQELTVREVATGKDLGDRIEWARFTTPAWRGDGFYYSRYDAPPEGREYSTVNRFHKLYYHRIGTPQSEDQLVYVDDHPESVHFVATTEDERFLIVDTLPGADKSQHILVQNLSRPDSRLQTFLTGPTRESEVVGNIDDKLLVRTVRGAPNYRLVLVDPDKPEEKHWQVLLPERPELLEAVVRAGDVLVAQYLKDVTSRVHVYDLQGKPLREIELPGLGTAGIFGGGNDEKELFLDFDSFVHPYAIYRLAADSDTLELLRRDEADFNPDLYETRQVFFPSKDGTRIPAFITHRKGIALDGTNPTLLYAYGGYAFNQTPFFNSALSATFDQGLVYVVANIRGGGEYGETWHKGGMLQNTQNRFDDFIAAAEYLVKEKYTSPQRLGIMGGSHGGALVGAVMLQRPDLFQVALPQVGTLDLLRFHKFTIGHFWKTEYGDIDKAEDFHNLLAWSPVHNVKPGMDYPATLVTTADRDDRVVPMHSYKFISELQARQAGERPVLIRIETDAGHSGSSLTKGLDQTADAIAFFYWNMGFRTAAELNLHE